jgi:hypothetical protein
MNGLILRNCLLTLIIDNDKFIMGLHTIIKVLFKENTN